MPERGIVRPRLRRLRLPGGVEGGAVSSQSRQRLGPFLPRFSIACLLHGRSQGQEGRIPLCANFVEGGAKGFFLKASESSSRGVVVAPKLPFI